MRGNNTFLGSAIIVVIGTKIQHTVDKKVVSEKTAFVPYFCDFSAAEQAAQEKFVGQTTQFGEIWA